MKSGHKRKHQAEEEDEEEDEEDEEEEEEEEEPPKKKRKISKKPAPSDDDEWTKVHYKFSSNVMNKCSMGKKINEQKFTVLVNFCSFKIVSFFT